MHARGGRAGGATRFKHSSAIQFLQSLASFPTAGTQAPGLKASEEALQSPPELGVRSRHTSGRPPQSSTPTAATGAAPKAWSVRGTSSLCICGRVGGAAPLLLEKPEGTPIRSSRHITYRLLSPTAAAAAAAPPNRAATAAAILLRVRKRGTGLAQLHRAPKPRAGAGADAGAGRLGAEQAL